MEKQIQRFTIESEIEELEQNRSKLGLSAEDSLQARLSLEAVQMRYDDEKRGKLALLSLAEQDEEAARTEWTERRQAKEAFVKLRNKAFEEWQAEELKQEQKALDEWTTSRFAA